MPLVVSCTRFTLPNPSHANKRGDSHKTHSQQEREREEKERERERARMTTNIATLPCELIAGVLGHVNDDIDYTMCLLASHIFYDAVLPRTRRERSALFWRASHVSHLVGLNDTREDRFLYAVKRAHARGTLYGISTECLVQAAGAGSLQTLRFLLTLVPHLYHTDILEEAIENGKLHVAHYLLETRSTSEHNVPAVIALAMEKPDFSPLVIKTMASMFTGDLEVLKRLLGRNTQTEVSAVIRRGDVGLIEWLRKCRVIELKADHIKHALDGGHWLMIDYLLARVNPPYQANVCCIDSMYMANYYMARTLIPCDVETVLLGGLKSWKNTAILDILLRHHKERMGKSTRGWVVDLAKRPHHSVWMLFFAALAGDTEQVCAIRAERAAQGLECNITPFWDSLGPWSVTRPNMSTQRVRMMTVPMMEALFAPSHPTTKRPMAPVCCYVQYGHLTHNNMNESMLCRELVLSALCRDTDRAAIEWLFSRAEQWWNPPRRGSGDTLVRAAPDCALAYLDRFLQKCRRKYPHVRGSAHRGKPIGAADILSDGDMRVECSSMIGPAGKAAHIDILIDAFMVMDADKTWSALVESGRHDLARRLCAVYGTDTMRLKICEEAWGRLVCNDDKDTIRYILCEVNVSMQFPWFEQLCAQGRLGTVLFVSHLVNHPCDRDSVLAAIASGHTELVDYLLDQDPHFQKEDVEASSQEPIYGQDCPCLANGDSDSAPCTTLFDRKNGPTFAYGGRAERARWVRAIEDAIGVGCWDMAERVRQRMNLDYTARAIDKAVAAGRIDLVRRLCAAHRVASSSKAYTLAASRGYLGIIRFLYNSPAFDKKPTSYAVEAAARYGYRPVVEFLLDSGVPYTSEAFSAAAYGNHGHVVRLFVAHAKPLLPPGFAMAKERCLANRSYTSMNLLLAGIA